MTIQEARKIQRAFFQHSNPSEEESFLFTEAMEYLIVALQDPRDMMELGGYYYEQRRFDLALKYYEMAASYDYEEADSCLGYIWYYGRTGQRDYEKAFTHFLKSMKQGNLVSAYKVADMYKNGYYVEKDEDKYKEIIESLYPKVKNARNVFEPLPEVFTRLAKIRLEQGQEEEAVFLYLRAKDILAQRISYNAFFGNLSIMKWLVNDLYQLIAFDENGFDLFDLYYVLQTEHTVQFTMGEDVYQVESLKEDGQIVIHFLDQWYRDIDSFFSHAHIDEAKLTALYPYLDGYKVIR